MNVLQHQAIWSIFDQLENVLLQSIVISKKNPMLYTQIISFKG